MFDGLDAEGCCDVAFAGASQMGFIMPVIIKMTGIRLYVTHFIRGLAKRFVSPDGSVIAVSRPIFAGSRMEVWRCYRFG